MHNDRGRRAFRCVVWRGVAEGAIRHGQHRVGQIRGFFELEGKFCLGQQRREFFHAVQRLHATLRLLGFAGLRLEAGNKLLQMCDFVLLFAKSGLLLLQLFGAHVFKLAVVAAKTVQFAQLDLHGHTGHRVQKLAVMADDQHRAFIAFQPGFQPHQRVQVQMVGWLVQQQKVRRAHQRTRQLQAHTPTAGEAVDGVL